jgi:RNA polymerase sigma-70 factor (ECF subfamily)
MGSPAGPDSERQLVRRLLAGDEAAFGAFFETHFARLFRFALGRVGQDADVAEEVAQAALTRAVRQLAKFRGESALFTWLCTFCRHEIAAHYERRGRRPPEIALGWDQPEARALLESLASCEASPEQELQRAEIGRRVHAVLAALPSHHASALQWKYIEGRSVDEIAARLGLGAKAAESLLTRARSSFREAFAALYPETEGSLA